MSMDLFKLYDSLESHDDQVGTVIEVGTVEPEAHVDVTEPEGDVVDVVETGEGAECGETEAVIDDTEAVVESTEDADVTSEMDSVVDQSIAQTDQVAKNQEEASADLLGEVQELDATVSAMESYLTQGFVPREGLRMVALRKGIVAEDVGLESFDIQDDEARLVALTKVKAHLAHGDQ